MREAFKTFRCFYPATKDLIIKCNSIIDQFMADGFFLTLRQLYYQLIGLDWFPEDRRYVWNGSKWVKHPNGTKNAQPNYDWLGKVVSDARLAGLIDWEAIEDRTRGVKAVPHWNSPEDIIKSAADSFRIDKWSRQQHRIEVWVEKDALVGVLEKACRPLDVKWFSCRGYTSQTALYDASKRLMSYIHQDQTPVIIHLGDHDPSGIDMTRDIFERLDMFIAPYGFLGQVEVDRIALNWDQVQEKDLPPSPAKEGDSRFKDYQDRFGDDTWELDALNPRDIVGMVEQAIIARRDEDAWDDDVETENTHRTNLLKASDRWDEVKELVRKKKPSSKVAKKRRKKK